MMRIKPKQTIHRIADPKPVGSLLFQSFASRLQLQSRRHRLTHRYSIGRSLLFRVLLPKHPTPLINTEPHLMFQLFMAPLASPGMIRPHIQQPKPTHLMQAQRMERNLSPNTVSRTKGPVNKIRVLHKFRKLDGGVNQKTYSNVMERKMTETEDVMLEILDNQPVHDNNIRVIREWDGCLKGKEITEDYQRHRHMQKVPPLLLEGDKGCRNRECYVPRVVSLGPYHYKQARLARAEEYKLITLEEYRLSTGKSMISLYNKVFEVVNDARKCYIDGSTDSYDDHEFNQMMLRDGCFILFYIECISCENNKVMLHNEYLGALGFANVSRDMLLLENQIPFVVLEVLLNLKFPKDEGEDVLNGFFNYLNYGEVIIRDEKVLKNKHPLHLLELYRSYFISLSASLSLRSSNSSMGRRRTKEKDSVEDYNYIKRNRSFASVTELKAKGIFLRCTHDESRNEGIKFYSRYCYGELVLVRRAVSSNTKAIYLNMISYEMCPHNANDFRITTYLRVMKSLIIQRDDVKELRNSGVLLHSLGRDEEVVQMYDEIEAPGVNIYMFHQLRRGIEKHCNNKYKTWVAELINVYFSSPWKTVALLVATAILITSFLQTYFAIRPLPDDSEQKIMKLLRHCVPPTPA